MKRSPIQRTASLSRSGSLRPRSAKRQKWMREERVPFVAAVLAERPWCEIQWDERCELVAVDVDEIVLRSAGGCATDPANVLAACRNCHSQKHLNPAEAELRGFYRRGHGGAA